ncbi:MAG: EAL domain-containing protein [Erysipelotrichaceae bacterium]|nr:EAL domain-containing protein [Erysipelotrichaceae bacterium]
MSENITGGIAGISKRKLLVVEDERINRELLRVILAGQYDLVFAENGKQALQLVHEHMDTLSLILLDLNLPDVHGLDLLQQIKGEDQLSHIPVIVMTADREAEVESLGLGAIDFIPKPYPQPKVMHARIQRTIELSEGKDIIRWTERDHLTGLYNREYFYRYASQLDNYHKDVEMDAIVLDINHFHILNERYGKPFGDEILIKLGHILRGIINANGGIVCRREADTFLMYRPHQENCSALMEEISKALGDDNHIRLRMGVYYNVDREIDIERRFDRAKSAADTVRNNYKNNIGIYDVSLHEAEVFAEQLLEDFPTAINEKQFVVYYQPKFDVRPSEPQLSSAEALVRWKHPQLGMISPGIFIPLFEENGLIQQLDTYVWRETASQIRKWKTELGMNIPVSVNVSRVDMYDPDLIYTLEDIVHEFDLDYSELFLEITESAYTDNSEQIISEVNKMREKGFRIEMDDFGSGYSSLNMISSLPIDALKLDMQFIRNAFKQRKDTRLLEIVITLAESLNVPTIAEGVETAEQMFTLKTMGCDYVQGYYFSTPLPADEFSEYVRNLKKEETEEITGNRNERNLQRDKYTYDALHDELTGLYNHTAFDVLFHDSDKDHIAVLLANIDDFARMKAEHGRKYADEVVRTVGMTLRDNFRSVDDICRLKEDEFVIIMTRITDSNHNLVYEKVELINELLEKETGNVSLSFGVAFSDRENAEGDIFEDADKALNTIKDVHKRGCVIF